MRQNAVTCALKKTGVLATLILLVLVPAARADPGFTLEDVKTWQWVGSTHINSVACGDVDGDGQAEIITGGWHNDGTRDRAQLAVWRWGPTTVTLEAIADSYVNSLSPDSNYGSEANIRTDITTGTTKNYNCTYVMFDLSGIPSDAVISSAKLSLYMTGVSGYVPWGIGRIYVHYCSDTSWTELGITWNNKPPFDSEATSYRSFGPVIPVPQYYDWDVTSDVSRALGNGKLAEVVKWSNYTDPDVWARARFQSKEAANKPKLIVEYFTYSLEAVVDWYWVSHTRISSVAVGDVDGDGFVEIVTGGVHEDGTRDVAQLCVWDGATLALEDLRTWYWVGNTVIQSVAVGDVDDDGSVEIVTGGYYDDGSRDVAQLAVWDGSTMTLEGVKTWYWASRTKIWSVAVGDADGDGATEIVTGGDYWDGTRSVAQLCVWTGSTLALEDVTTWYWTSHTLIHSVVVGNVDGDGSLEIVTGGGYHDGTRYRAQLCVWDGATLTLEDVRTWYWTEETHVQSVAVGDVDGDGTTEIVTGGTYGLLVVGAIAQLCVWTGATLTLEGVKTWNWGLGTLITSVALSDVDGDGATEIVTGGSYESMHIAQLCVWGFT